MHNMNIIYTKEIDGCHAGGSLATSASSQVHFFFLQQRKTNQVNLQKDVISTQNQRSCKKRAALCKMSSYKSQN